MVFSVVVVFGVALHSGLGAPLIVPPGVHPGDQYRLTFASANSVGLHSTHSSYYNDKVTGWANAAAELAALGTTWTAIITANNDFGTKVAAWDNTDTNPSVSAGVPIYNTAGELVATSNADLWDGTIEHPIESTENGDDAVAFFVWTGTTPVYGSAQSHSIPGPAVAAGAITSTFTNEWWAEYSDESPYNTDESYQTFSLYGISGVLTVVPEPSALLLAACAAVAIVPWACRRKRPGRFRKAPAARG